ncbi:MAG: decaprenyl-phosphate phosphoribosyltransferase [Sulfuritalea sp.]|jgi:4-hydroxybenzoate polyprenyltransferase|nr:decaprenyl-phosphate phosphoribosyltransferase [Sulfuritalea sp.]MBP6636184.1 decaprenyl-phosphate phosphoribosyltransferase [Sulfuritalea sp.]MBP7422151.1 decaprenyl-phosphate phosphoribosyltransferase [Sulfuritalea sp.]
MPPLISLLRPHQWLKNGFVFLGLLFGHAWSDPVKLGQGLAAFAAFCLLASAVYVMNDLVDREQDRLHPKKKHRPLAAGTVGVVPAQALALACLVGGSVIAWLWAGSAPWVFAAYVLLNLGYSFGLKHVVILDVFIIAAGFMLRILAGTLGIGIAPSQWLLLCGLMLTLFLGFAKRRAELAALQEDSVGHRRVLEHYTAPMLDQFIGVTAAGTVISYALYTVSAETVAMHGTRALIATVPFVLYGMLRYLWKLHARGGGGDPAQELLRDPHLLAATAGWLLLVFLLLGGLGLQ